MLRARSCACMQVDRRLTVLQERGALSERVMNEMRRLEEIRDQCCRLRESAAADVAAERKVCNTRLIDPLKMLA